MYRAKFGSVLPVVELIVQSRHVAASITAKQEEFMLLFKGIILDGMVIEGYAESLRLARHYLGQFGDHGKVRGFCSEDQSQVWWNQFSPMRFMS